MEFEGQLRGFSLWNVDIHAGINQWLRKESHRQSGGECMTCPNCRYHLYLSPFETFLYDLVYSYAVPVLKGLALGAFIGLAVYWFSNINMGVMR